MDSAKTYLDHEYVLTNKEFNLFRELIYDKAGIYMADTKKGLISGRLTKRLRHFNLANFGEYYAFVHSDTAGSEMQVLVDLLTTNETYFFREQKHFDFLRELIVKNYKPSHSFKIWSAASSSGEEAYSMAMLLAGELGFLTNWNILATDLNQQVLETAKRGLYPMSAAEKIPNEYLRLFCLKGCDQYSDYFMIEKTLKSKIQFQQINLNGAWHNIGPFDLIVLRNVMIYFDKETRKKLMSRIAKKLTRKGYLFISHSESLTGVSESFKCIQPAIYQLK